MTLLQLLKFVIQVIQPFLVPVCFLLAWALMMILGWTVWSSVRDATQRAKRMHQIPCANCQFFTNDHRLKCTLNPTIANTEEAINCSDYRPDYVYSQIE